MFRLWSVASSLKKQVYVTLSVKHYHIQAVSAQILSIFLGHLHLPQNCSHLSQPFWTAISYLYRALAGLFSLGMGFLQGLSGVSVGFCWGFFSSPNTINSKNRVSNRTPDLLVIEYRDRILCFSVCSVILIPCPFASTAAATDGTISASYTQLFKTSIPATPLQRYYLQSWCFPAMCTSAILTSSCTYSSYCFKLFKSS